MRNVGTHPLIAELPLPPEIEMCLESWPDRPYVALPVDAVGRLVAYPAFVPVYSCVPHASILLFTAGLFVSGSRFINLSAPSL